MLSLREVGRLPFNVSGGARSLAVWKGYLVVGCGNTHINLYSDTVRTFLSESVTEAASISLRGGMIDSLQTWQPEGMVVEEKISRCQSFSV